MEAIIAPTFARIFYRNSVDGGFVIPYESLKNVSEKIETGDQLEIEAAEQTVRNITKDERYKIRQLGSVSDIVNAGGIFEFARKEGMIDVAS